MAGRIKRGDPPKRKLKRRKERVALPELMRDFQGRCAYSMQHWELAGGEKCMEVDHFDPREKNNLNQRYDNLFLATRHCNLSKQAVWPTAAELLEGERYLNPCKE